MSDTTSKISPQATAAALAARGQKEARERGFKRYFTGKPCSRGHINERRASDRKCIACNRENSHKLQKKGGSQYKARVRGRKKWRKQGQGDGAVRARFVICLHRRLNNALKGNFKSGSAVRDLGCSIAEFRTYIAAKFQPGMSWGNYGEWHLDHIKPLASFNLADREQFLKAFHFTNYQPLWAKDNLAKGSKIL